MKKFIRLLAVCAVAFNVVLLAGCNTEPEKVPTEQATPAEIQQNQDVGKVPGT